MNKITASNKFVLMIATMLPAIMLATSLTLSLIPTIAFAQEDNEDSDNQSDINENEEESQENDQDANSEARSDGNVGDNSVFVSPQVQTTTLVAANLNVDTDV